MGQITQGVMKAIVENRSRFEAFCYSLSADELDRPVPDSSWIVRDFISHLATLDPMLEGIFRATVAGTTFDAGAANMNEGGFDVDAFNESAVVERRSWPVAQVFEDGAGRRASLVAALAEISDEQAESMMHFAGDAKRKAGTIPLKLFLAGWSQHDPIHAADMLKALPERASDASLTAWITNPFVAGYQRAMAGPPRDVAAEARPQ